MTIVPDLGLGRTWPSLEVFTLLAAQRRVVPVVRRFMADAETPVGLYRKLAANRPGTFLLETAEHGGGWARYSIIGVRTHATLSAQDGEVCWIGEPPAGVPTEGLALDALAETLAALRTEPLEGLPPLTSGMVGMIAYDAVRHWEPLSLTNPDELNLPDVSMMLATDLAVMDHADGSVLLIANAINYDNTAHRVEWAWRDAVERLDALTAQCAAQTPSTIASLDAQVAADALGHVTSSHTSEDFQTIVESAQEDIRAGEVFQVVLSQRFSIPCTVDALEVYRTLRASNPSPYMYLLRFTRPDGTAYDVVGGSPEALVTVNGTSAITHPIAGSRPRGKTEENDINLGEELLADPKERAEHIMLVDLGRNDMARVCDPGTVEVAEFMEVRRYSHVMHLESTVAGQLRRDRSGFDALVATFPAGTLSGAPKPRAMELIERYETTRRGLYGGIVGYFDFHGNLDTAIAIRTAVIDNGIAYVQAGAGIVADSVPADEDRECHAKAAAVLRAVATASGLRTPW